MTFELPSNVNKDKIFMVRYCNVTGKRLAPLFYSGNLYQFIDNSIFPFFCVGELVVYMKSGFASGKQDQANAENGIIQIRPTNINDDRSFVFDRNIYIDKAIVETRSADILVSGEVLFNNTNSQILVGKSIFFDLNGDYCCSNHITRIMPDESRVSAEYLTLIFNLYQRNKLFYKVCTNWNNQSGVNVEQLAQVKIPVPSLGKQKEITRFFNSAFKRKKSKENSANRLLASIDGYLLSELGIPAQQQEEDNSLEKRIFIRKYSDVAGGRVDPYFYRNIYIKLIESLSESDYDLVSLSGLSSIINGYDARNFIEEGTMYLRVSNIRKDDFLLDDVKFIPITEIKKDIQLNLGDILLTRKGSYGVSVVVDDRVLSAIISSEIFLLRLNDKEKVNANYISAYFNSIIGQVLFDRIKTGAIMGHVSQDALRGFGVLLPPLEKQREMVAHIAEIRQQAKQLREEAAQELEQTKVEVERMILGE